MSADKNKKQAWSAETGEEPGSQTQAWLNEPQQARQPTPPPAEDAPRTWRARLWRRDEEPETPQPTSTLSRAQRVLMGLIAAAGLVTWLMPVLLMLWFMVLLVIIGLTELMESGHLAAIAAQSTGSLITIYTLFAAALLGLPTITIAALKERGKWPRRWPESLSATLAGFTVFGLMGLFYLMDERSRFPTFFFDVVLEAVGWAWMIFLPWFCLRTIALGWRALWRWMNTLPFWSGMLTGIFAVITAVATSSWILLEVSLWAFVERQDQHAAAHLHTPIKAAGPASLSPREVIANLAPEPNRDRTPFQRCAQELSSPRLDHLGQSWTDEAIHILMSRGTARDTAYDVAHAALLNVCEHYETQELDTLGPYYIVSVRNEARTQWRRYSREERCPSLEPAYEHSTPEFGFTLDRLIDFSKRLCKIDQQDQEILLLMAQGHTSVEIGARLKMTPASVRQRITRARAELRELYEQERRR